MSNEFKREERYIVFKMSDLGNSLKGDEIRKLAREYAENRKQRGKWCRKCMTGGVYAKRPPRGDLTNFVRSRRRRALLSELNPFKYLGRHTGIEPVTPGATIYATNKNNQRLSCVSSKERLRQRPVTARSVTRILRSAAA